MECVELAPAFEPRHTSDSGSKLHALHTLRETRPPLSSVCAICSVSPKICAKKQDFRLYYSARRRTPRPQPGALRTDAPYLPAVTDPLLSRTGSFTAPWHGKTDWCSSSLRDPED